jgi:hypothetical protein
MLIFLFIVNSFFSWTRISWGEKTCITNVHRMLGIQISIVFWFNVQKFDAPKNRFNFQWVFWQNSNN